MNILLVSRGLPDDVYPLNGIFELDNAKALAAAGHKVTMLVADFRSHRFRRRYGLYCTRRDDINVCVLSLPLNCYRRARPVLSALVYWAACKAVRRFGKPDVVHAHFYFMAAIANWLPRRRHIPFVVTEHSSKLNTDLGHISKLDRQIARAAYRHADRVTSVSGALAKRLQANFGTDSTVIPDIVDTETMQFVPRPQGGNAFRFCSVGNLVAGKRFDLLVDAFAAAFGQDDKVTLDIIGDGPERENLNRRIQQAGLAGRITLHGRQNRARVADLLRRSDAFALFSAAETFGVVYVEALSTGRPVGATACGGPEDFVSPQDGVLVPCNDLQAATRALQTLHRDIDRFDGEAISQRCRARFSPASIAAQLAVLYQELL